MARPVGGMTVIKTQGQEARKRKVDGEVQVHRDRVQDPGPDRAIGNLSVAADHDRVPGQDHLLRKDLRNVVDIENKLSGICEVSIKMNGVFFLLI